MDQGLETSVADIGYGGRRLQADGAGWAVRWCVLSGTRTPVNRPLAPPPTQERDSSAALLLGSTTAAQVQRAGPPRRTMARMSSSETAVSPVSRGRGAGLKAWP